MDKTKTKNIVKPLRGFSDWFSADVKLRQFVIDTFKQTFEKYGYEPLETPALEYTKNILNLSGSEAEKQFYRFKDPGGRDVMLKYEVMIGMCRAVASNINNLSFPYKRYQIQPVWRAENTQKGRYRQFTQCDADTIGTSSVIADAEFIQMGIEIIKKLGFKKFVTRISNRKILTGLQQYLDIPQSKFYGMCMSLDKLNKTGIDGVKKELLEKRKLKTTQIKKIFEVINTKTYKNLTNQEIIDKLTPTIGTTKIGAQGLDELSQIFDYFILSKIPSNLYRFDTSIARGLASYTGPVWEFDVVDGNVGSIAGCGRYDNVIGKYLGQNTIIPATGGSFGIERICDIIKDQNIFTTDQNIASTLVTIFSNEFTNQSITIANQLRKNNIKTLLYPQVDKLAKQFKYANKKMIPFVIVIGPDETKNNTVTLKNMTSGKQETITIKQAIKKLSNPT